MALITCEYFSDVLGMMRSMRVILPQDVNRRIGITKAAVKYENLPVLYLLHGLSDNDSAWIRRTSIERYAEKWGIAVVMPNGERSWYTDAVCGYKYYSHIAYEVPEIARQFFPLSAEREDNFIAGLSMGGYGAFKIALKNPQVFAYAASMSGALDIAKRYGALEDKEFLQEFSNLVGPLDKIAGSENDLLQILEEADPEESPKLLQCCGTEDYLYGMNKIFRKKAEKYGFDLTYWEGEGEHVWDYWDAEIQNVLRKIRIRRK